MSATTSQREMPGLPSGQSHGHRPTRRQGLLADLPGWEIIVRDGMDQLSGDFEFANFAEALAFTNRVGELAEEADHHPAITTEWGRVNVRWWTHSIGGLHRNDFIMAARASAAAEG